MAEDIVASWHDAKEMAVGLAMAGYALLERGVVTHEQHNELLASTLRLADAVLQGREGLEYLSGPMPLDINMEFRLEDSTGKEITFPIQLICNTSYRRDG